MHRFKIWILKCWSWTVYTSRVYPIHERDGKMGFLNSLYAAFPNFSHITKEFENWDF